MKNIINYIKNILLGYLIFTPFVYAQLSMPRISPAAKVSQTIGLSRIDIEYSRPSVKGREIWGKLVPWGLAQNSIGTQTEIPWRVGANENTTISFMHDAFINGEKIYAGKYGFHIIPKQDEDWIIIFSKDNSSWGSFFYDQKNDALRINVKPKEDAFVEWLEFSFDEITENSCVVELNWEKIEISFVVQFDVHKIVIDSLKQQLKGLLGFNWQSWNQAAAYCLQINDYLDLAEDWCKTSINLNENANNRNLLGYISFAQGKKDEAVKIFEENTIKFSNNWNVYDSFGEILNKIGDKSLAKRNYEKALQLAPKAQKTRIEAIINSL